MTRVTPGGQLARWRAFREQQRAALRESNRFTLPAHTEAAPGRAEPPLWADLLEDDPTTTDRVDPAATDPTTTDRADEASPPPRLVAEGRESAGRAANADPAAPAAPAASPDALADESASRFGPTGRPLNRRSPLWVGFFGALGALIAIGLWQSLGRLATTLTILLVATFLTLALDPIVEALVRRGVSRGKAVLITFAGLVVVFVAIGLLVVPPAVTQGAALLQQAPTYVQDVLDSSWVRRVDRQYQVVDKVQEELTARLTDQNFITTVLGGIVGAGRALATGVFQILTVLVLTLYFLSSLPRIKQSAYAMVPSTRRTRVTSLSEEIMRRTGSYAIGQSAIASTNAVLSWVMMTVVGIPYAAVLAVAVGLLGLIPMIGATLGAVIVCIVALFDRPASALIAGVYYVIYQQIENYVIAPRILQRTVSVPGAVTVVAALAGGTLLGVLGALLAIPFAAGLLLLYEEVLIPRQRDQ
ncbi:MAG TPA: AI-2E family transporter [Dermatophilaceae bacterium]|nr:AI-2E family transporter [Dermatophilaceae bacterium]